MEPKIKKYNSPLEMVEKLASELKKISDDNSAKNKNTNIAISGGNTPKILFNVLSEEYKDKIDWQKINFFWVDERCVPATYEDSNYGTAKKYLFDNIEIPEDNIHRVVGENQPEKEADRYARVIDENILTTENGFPEFDIIILGMGTDGHTASIFQDNIELFNSEKVCAVTEHPVTKQKRITITGMVINNAKRVFFMITGEEKAKVVKNIFEKKKGYIKYPAALVDPVNGIYEWYLDERAGKLLK